MGNPTYQVTLTNGLNYLTETNGGIGYAVNNYSPHSTRNPYPAVILTLTRAGRITDITPLADTFTGYVATDERAVTDFNGRAVLSIYRRSATRTGFRDATGRRALVHRYWAAIRDEDGNPVAAYYGANGGASLSIRMRRTRAITHTL